MPKYHDPYANQPVLRGPFSLFEDSFIVEFLQVPPSLSATCLLRITVKCSHPLISQRNHPQVPPLHLHFDQSESFQILQGRYGFKLGYDRKEKIVTPEDGVITIPPWQPHAPFALPGEEDAVVVMWAHPNGVVDPLDQLFFEATFKMLDEAHRKGTVPSLFEMMMLQQNTASPLIMLSRWSLLGPLRWWIQYVFQAGIAYLGSWLGYEAMPRRLFKEE